MGRTGLWLALAVVVVSNLCALELAAVNRRGEPDAVVRLTEREATLVPGGPENTAVSLRLAWTDPNGDREAGWFDRAKLSELGFDCRLPVNRENAAHYRAIPWRRAYAALEYDGPAWQRYAAGLAAGVDTTSADGLSHLVLVDVDRDPARLRARHPDRTRVVVVHAVVHMMLVQEPGRPPFLKGRVVEVRPSELNLPRDLRREAEPLVARTGAVREARVPGATIQSLRPRYVATIRWGQHLEPWVDSIRTTDARQ